jgi:biopolymer transport protein ExbB/TolQ
MSESASPLDSVADPSVTDPLSEVTRAERKALLASCVIGLAISVGGLVPEKIETFGIEVSATQEQNLLQILAGVITYYLIGFSIYAWSDLKRRESLAVLARAKIGPTMNSAMEDYKSAQKEFDSKDPSRAAALFNDKRFLRLAALSDQAKLAQRVSRAGTVRVAFDVYLPMIVAFGSVVTVLASARESAGARWLSGVLIMLAAGVALTFIWRQRTVMRKSVRKKIRDWRDRRRKRIMAEMEILPAEDPRRAKLAEKVKRSLERTLQDYKDGIV